MANVTLQDPARANLMAFFVRSLLEKRLARPETSRKAEALRGRFSLEGSGMKVVMEFGPSGVSLTSGAAAGDAAGDGAADAGVRGELSTLLGVCLGKGFVWPVLTGRLRVKGNPIRLWPLLGILVE